MVLLAACLVFGCQSSGTAEEAKEAKTSATGTMRVAVIPKGTTHEFWKSVEAGALRAGKELNVEVIWKGPLREDDKDQQIKVVEDFVTRGVDGIALAPLDDTGLRVPVKEAQDAGIPVLIFDSALKDQPVVSFVATDNKAAGKSGGKRLGELLGGKGKVMMLRYQEGSASTMEREEGFLEAMKEYPGIEVVSANQFGGATVETAQTAAESLLNRYKTGEKLSIDGIFTPNESTTFGMLRALENSGLAGNVKFVGFDSSKQLMEALLIGKIQALVVQNPEQMGYLAVKTLVQHLKGEKVEARIDTGSQLKVFKELPQMLTPGT